MKPYLKYVPLALFSVVIGGSAVAKLTMAAPLAESFAALGYPSYLLIILGVSYILGIIGLWQTMSTSLKEWAFAGFTIAMIGAFSSHMLAGDPISKAAPSLILLALLAASYWLVGQKGAQA
ncbi:MAG: DoxX family protein [Pseudomonadota bacterium]